MEDDEDQNSDMPATLNRRENGRRDKPDRRNKKVPVAMDRRKGERRRTDRRRQIDPTTCEREYNDEELDFLKAIEAYKKEFLRPFPTWSEILEVLLSMGYRKVAEPTKIKQKREKGS